MCGHVIREERSLEIPDLMVMSRLSDPTKRDGHAAVWLGPYPHGSRQGGDGRMLLEAIKGNLNFQ